MFTYTHYYIWCTLLTGASTCSINCDTNMILVLDICISLRSNSISYFLQVCLVSASPLLYVIIIDWCRLSQNTLETFFLHNNAYRLQVSSCIEICCHPWDIQLLPLRYWYCFTWKSEGSIKLSSQIKHDKWETNVCGCST